MPIERSWERAKRLFEALLFASGRAVDEKTVERICGLRGQSIEKAAQEINDELSSHPFRVERVEEGWQMVLKEDYSVELPPSLGRKLLSRGELRTLALIAANEPIKLADLVAARGNSARRHLRKLTSLSLVNVSREGRGKVIRTTSKFKSLFQVTVKGVGESDAIRDGSIGHQAEESPRTSFRDTRE
ncbi:MAG: SMC-Scp complex subunit ScpB [Candidatus Korarchaeum sp.]|nr:SMC-Scp complex subunit ScpB [Candidatus Korarchaeum sp.]MDW8035557.1 SMC-Scp complex subunit ScpB [Candidatus Korarchaeum sp.]